MNDNKRQRRLRYRARKRQYQQLTSTTFKVWGGELEHLVELKNGKWICDCAQNQVDPANHQCCHVVGITTYQIQSEAV